MLGGNEVTHEGARIDSEYVVIDFEEEILSELLVFELQ